VKLARNTLLNLVGLGAPLLVALVAIPQLIEQLGLARFGLLTLIWAVVSYFGLFDLGLGRALTQRLAQALARGADDEIGPLTATALALMAAVGAFAAVAMALLAEAGVALVGDVPDRAEAVRALWAMAAAVPAVVLTSGLRGVLEARQAFGWVNAIRLPMGVYTFLAPLAVVALWGPRLDAIAAMLAAGRVVALAVHVWAAWRVLPQAHGRLHMQRRELRPLLTTGGWLTVGNLVSPLMGYADRFIIAAAASAAAVAHYATPQEIVTKLWIAPGALTAVLFPAFAGAAVRGGSGGSGGSGSWALALHSVRWLFVALLPPTLALALFAHELLGLWIGAAFAQASAPLLQVMAAGILINCLAHVPLTLLQGAGQVRATALLQLVQVVPYLALLAWATARHGAAGAVAVWFLRMVFDTAVLFWLAWQTHAPRRVLHFGAHAAAAAGTAALAFALCAADVAAPARLAAWTIAVCAAALLLRPWAVLQPPRADTLPAT